MQRVSPLYIRLRVMATVSESAEYCLSLSCQTGANVGSQRVSPPRIRLAIMVTVSTLLCIYM